MYIILSLNYFCLEVNTIVCSLFIIETTHLKYPITGHRQYRCRRYLYLLSLP